MKLVPTLTLCNERVNEWEQSKCRNRCNKGLIPSKWTSRKTTIHAYDIVHSQCCSLQVRIECRRFAELTSTTKKVRWNHISTRLTHYKLHRHISTRSIQHCTFLVRTLNDTALRFQPTTLAYRTPLCCASVSQRSFQISILIGCQRLKSNSSYTTGWALKEEEGGKAGKGWEKSRWHVW